LHYAATLEHWMERFEGVQDQVTELYDAHFTRAWHMYLAGSTAAFRAGSLQLFQVVFTHGDNNNLRPTRRHLYNSPAAPQT
jgi:cyclopropane-fatty-acyl-phospholipid synthase